MKCYRLDKTAVGGIGRSPCGERGLKYFGMQK